MYLEEFVLPEVTCMCFSVHMYDMTILIAAMFVYSYIWTEIQYPKLW
jgi:hypothetical protein